MPPTLYEILDLEATATPEEIRKAYKKKALKTHPDRLPPTATDAEKKASEEKFRNINHAYEILIDAEKRKEYDFHGTWPPPDIEEIPRPSGSRSRHTEFNDPFSHPFFHNHTPHRSFAFTDPFTLFDSIFRDFGSHRPRFGGFGPSWDDPFARMERELDAELGGPFVQFSSAFGMLGSLPFQTLLPNTQVYPTIQGNNMGGGRSGWQSESFSTQSVNGVTQSVHKRRDFEGNEHVTRTYPDGREVYTINGVEQPRGQIPNGPAAHQLHSSSRHQITSSNPQPIQRSASLDISPPYETRPYSTPRHDRRYEGDYNMRSHALHHGTPDRRHRSSDRRHTTSSSFHRDHHHQHGSHSKPPTPNHRMNTRYPYRDSQDRDPYYDHRERHYDHYAHQPAPPLHYQPR